MEMDMDTWKEESMDILLDDKLKCANTAALETGQLTPLIKEELWTKIQARRLSEGKNELTVNFKAPSKASMSKEEESKAALRRERNRLAAKKCRSKKKNISENVTKVLQEEQLKNTRLKEQLRQLEMEKMELLREHANRTPAGAEYSNWLPVRNPEPPTYQPEVPASDMATFSTPGFPVSYSPNITTSDTTTSTPVYLTDHSDKLTNVFPFVIKDELDMEESQVVPIDSMMYSFSM